MKGTPLRNPREKAGFLSLLTFSWINNVLKLGSKQPLEEKHLFPVETSNQAEWLAADLEREWLVEKRASEQKRTKPRLWRAMMRVISCRDYVIVVLIRILYSLTSNSLPLILWFFLRSISTASKASYSTTLAFVISIALTSSVRMFCNTHWIFKVEVIAIRLKVAVIGFVYKKVGNPSFTPNSIISHSFILLLLLLLLLLLHLSLPPPSLPLLFSLLYFRRLSPISFPLKKFSCLLLLIHSTAFPPFSSVLLPPPRPCSFSILFHHSLTPSSPVLSFFLLPFALFSSFPPLVYLFALSLTFSPSPSSSWYFIINLLDNRQQSL